jgi:PPOX class probable F420-dependent enzyme
VSMTKAERDAYLKEIRIGTLCTLNADGSPNALPIWYHWDGEKIRMFSSDGTGKTRRLAKDSRACLSVAAPVGTKESWVTVEGTIEILAVGGKELSLKLAPIYYDPAIFADQESAKKNIHHFETSENTVLLELTPTRIRST